MGSFKDFILVQYFMKGGPMMIPLLILSIISLAIFIERLIAFIRARIDTQEFMLMIREVIEGGNLDEAIEICDMHRGPIAAIIRQGIIRYDQLKRSSTIKARAVNKRELVEKTLENAATQELSYLERGLVWLATITNLAPILGFLGTVTGMIKAFEALAKQGLGDPTIVARGISEALITTATGLLIASPTIIFYNFFINKIDNFVLEIEDSAVDLLDAFDNLEQGIKSVAAEDE
ncbi:MAG TPA: MotA/TolQ/ExbB proton channel family protein [Firmicutes bacterium]|nr:MotA/TolQ/ExbB proton channel family protein [Bacillota bacterium]